MQANVHPRLISVLVVAVTIGFPLIQPGRPEAQPLTYTYTKITDSIATPGLGGVSCVGINNLGTVVVRLNNQDLHKGRDSASFTLVAGGVFSLCPSINDNDEISYTTAGGASTVILVKNANGALTTLADSVTSPRLSNTYLPSLNVAGRAAYVANENGETKIVIAPDDTIVATSPPLGFVSPASMNEAGIVAFTAFDQVSAKDGLYRGSTTPLLQNGDSISGGTILFSRLQRPVINNGGIMAFVGSLDMGGGTGTSGIHTTDGASVSLVGSTPIDRVSLNDAGAVVYRRTLSGGAGSGLYLGRPGLIDQEVIGQGDALDGSTVSEAFIWEEALNEFGQVAFWAHLTNGRQGIYVATPKWLDKLSFMNKVPACGPVTGKVVLAAAAPPGGLSVDLASANPAAAVPLNLVVPAGKKTATFQITLTPVLSKTLGDIEASFGAQTVARPMTVRPITVKSVTLAPNPVAGGQPVLGTVKLDCAAQPADLTVSLSSSKPAVASLPASQILIPMGNDSGTFDVVTHPIAAPTSATIKASALGTSKSKKLVVNP